MDEGFSDNLFSGVKLIEQGLRKFGGGTLDYNLKKLIKARELLLTRFAPFKVGDRITLSEDLQIEEGSCWWHCRHFLQPGSPATVELSDCDSDGRLQFFVQFDRETWIDRDGYEQPVISKHVFCLLEQQIKLL